MPSPGFVDLRQPSVPLDKIPYVDFPELKLDEHETTEMPFRYVTDTSGKPIMPEVWVFTLDTALTQTD